VETVGNVFRACSGCAGDYEDPDRTVWEEETEEDREEGEVQRWARRVQR
jgi:hypothetical protein